MNEKFEKILSAYTAVTPPYRRDIRLHSDLGISSLTMVELILALEEDFEIEFDLDTLDTTRPLTVGYLADLVENHAN